MMYEERKRKSAVAMIAAGKGTFNQRLAVGLSIPTLIYKLGPGGLRHDIIFRSHSATSSSSSSSPLLHYLGFSYFRVHMPIMDQPFIAKNCRNDKKFHILLAASGSVATIKLPNITKALCQNQQVSVRIIVSEAAERFLMNQSSEQPILDSLQQIDGVDGIYRDQDEWSPPWTRGGTVLHIELRKCW
jgi:hypothetical protein